jgi:integration host factor subunit beta
MLKPELVQRMVEHNPHLYPRDNENLIDAILDEISDALLRGERVELHRFGAFSAKQRQARSAGETQAAPRPELHRRRGGASSTS